MAREWEQLSRTFEAFGEYKNAVKLTDGCKVRKQECEEECLELEYKNAATEMQRLEKIVVEKPNDVLVLAKEWEQLSRAFKAIGNHRNADKLAEECKNRCLKCEKWYSEL